MILLCATLGFQQVTIKLALPDISPLMQAGLRSLMATGLLLIWTTAQGIPMLAKDGTLAAGLLSGLFFVGEFGFVYSGLSYTTASRMVVFLYMTPCLTALLLPRFVPSERLTTMQWLGILLSLGGVAYAFLGGSSDGGPSTFRGDVYGLLAAACWAGLTVSIRASALATVRPEKALVYQVAVGAAILIPLSLAVGEPGVMRWSTTAIGALVYQGVVIAFGSYLTWIWMLNRYVTMQVSSFMFLTPLFGVAFGLAALGEPVTAPLVIGAMLVCTGILLVNRKRRR